MTQPVEGFIAILAWGELDSDRCSMAPYPHVVIFDISLTGINMSNQEVSNRKGHILCAISNGHYGLDIPELLEFASHFVVVNQLTRIFQRHNETTLVLLTRYSEGT